MQPPRINLGQALLSFTFCYVTLAEFVVQDIVPAGLAITNPKKEGSTFVHYARTGDEACQSALASYKKSQKAREGYLKVDDVEYRFDIRLPNDPIIYSDESKVEPLETAIAAGLHPPDWVDTEEFPGLSTCQITCMETSPQQEGAPDYRAEANAVRDNVRVVVQKPEYNAIDYGTEYLPFGSPKSFSKYWFICEPGYRAVKKALKWFQQAANFAGQLRQSCACERDSGIQVQEAPLLIKPKEHGCVDTPALEGPGSLVIKMAEDQEPLGFGIADATTAAIEESSLPALVNGLTLSSQVGRTDITQKFPEGRLWEYDDIKKDTIYTVCAMNTHEFGLSMDTYVMTHTPQLALTQG